MNLNVKTNTQGLLDTSTHLLLLPFIAHTIGCWKRPKNSNDIIFVNFCKSDHLSKRQLSKQWLEKTKTNASHTTWFAWNRAQFLFGITHIIQSHNHVYYIPSYSIEIVPIQFQTILFISDNLGCCLKFCVSKVLQNSNAKVQIISE